MKFWRRWFAAEHLEPALVVLALEEGRFADMATSGEDPLALFLQGAYDRVHAGRCAAYARDRWLARPARYETLAWPRGWEREGFAWDAAHQEAIEALVEAGGSPLAPWPGEKMCSLEAALRCLDSATLDRLCPTPEAWAKGLRQLRPPKRGATWLAFAAAGPRELLERILRAPHWSVADRRAALTASTTVENTLLLLAALPTDDPARAAWPVRSLSCRWRAAPGQAPRVEQALGAEGVAAWALRWQGWEEKARAREQRWLRQWARRTGAPMWGTLVRGEVGDRRMRPWIDHVLRMAAMDTAPALQALPLLTAQPPTAAQCADVVLAGKCLLLLWLEVRLDRWWERGASASELQVSRPRRWRQAATARLTRQLLAPNPRAVLEQAVLRAQALATRWPSARSALEQALRAGWVLLHDLPQEHQRGWLDAVHASAAVPLVWMGTRPAAAEVATLPRALAAAAVLSRQPSAPGPLPPALLDWMRCGEWIDAVMTWPPPVFEALAVWASREATLPVQAWRDRRTLLQGLPDAAAAARPRL